LKKHVGHTYGFASSLQVSHRHMVDFPQLGHGKETADSDGLIGLWHQVHTGMFIRAANVFALTACYGLF